MSKREKRGPTDLFICSLQGLSVCSRAVSKPGCDDTAEYRRSVECCENGRGEMGFVPLLQKVQTLLDFLYDVGGVQSM